MTTAGVLVLILRPGGDHQRLLLILRPGDDHQRLLLILRPVATPTA